MATVWKHPNSPFWTAVFRDERNKWRKKTTKLRGKKNRARALTMALAFERAAAQGRDGTLTEAVSRKIIGGILESTGSQDLRADSAADFCETWLKGKLLARGERTSSAYRSIVGKFIAFLGEKAKRPISAIEPRDCQGFFDFQTERRLAPASVAQSLMAIRTVFNAARRQGLISINPAEAVELPRNLKPVRRGTFSTVQIKLLLKAAADDTEWQTAILFGYCTGLRLGDATSRDWADVDFLAGKLKFTTGKTGKLQVNPLTPDLHAHLSRLAGDKGGPICPRLAETRPDGRNGLTNQFFAIMKRAGIDKQAVNSGGRRTLATLSFHSLRKSYNSALAVQGVSQELRRKLVGHRSDRVNDLYTAEDFAALKKAVKTLPQLDPWLPGLEG